MDYIGGCVVFSIYVINVCYVEGDKKMKILPEEKTMRIFTLYAPENLLKFFDLLVYEGFYPSRSEIVRHMLYKGLPDLKEELAFMKRAMRDKELSSIKGYLEERGLEVRKKRMSKKYSEPLGNPFWEEDIRDDKLVFVNKEDPTKIVYFEDGKLKEYTILGEA